MTALPPSELEHRVAALERLNPVAHAVLVALCGLVLGTVPLESQRRILALLREGTTSILDGLTGSAPGELPDLVAEEIFAGLLDNVERLANSHRRLR
ncbi:hypothetical protein SAMN05216330_102440 [Bradyrhizobium sp. Ghvi]|uniref:hypothetical protein n=1 Tax=Bradyrhizobium sp. Ghvi TaxID=1855319 RepID=UPI0008E45DF6|nr:hypothetical protein [Bradyrhizobium sp. Ghvi]SFO25899.1 hypothetical protein SAMN05216330_102440 [Bradyrhizobium sp. Ghvi]